MRRMAVIAADEEVLGPRRLCIVMHLRSADRHNDGAKSRQVGTALLTASWTRAVPPIWRRTPVSCAVGFGAQS